MSDMEMVDEGQLEDVSGLLNRGEVANLFGVDEMARIVEQLPREKGMSGGRGGDTLPAG